MQNAKTEKSTQKTLHTTNSLSIVPLAANSRFPVKVDKSLKLLFGLFCSFKRIVDYLPFLMNYVNNKNKQVTGKSVNMQKNS